MLLLLSYYFIKQQKSLYYATFIYVSTFSLNNVLEIFLCYTLLQSKFDCTIFNPLYCIIFGINFLRKMKHEVHKLVNREVAFNGIYPHLGIILYGNHSTVKSLLTKFRCRFKNIIFIKIDFTTKNEKTFLHFTQCEFMYCMFDIFFSEVLILHFYR